MRWVAVAGANEPTHAVDVSATLERGVRSLMEHRAYLEALGDEDAETYSRNLVESIAGMAAERFGGRPAIAFDLYPR